MTASTRLVVAALTGKPSTTSPPATTATPPLAPMASQRPFPASKRGAVGTPIQAWDRLKGMRWYACCSRCQDKGTEAAGVSAGWIYPPVHRFGSLIFPKLYVQF